MKVQTEIRLEDYNAFLKLVYAKALRPWANALWTTVVVLPFAIVPGVLLGRRGAPGGDDGVTMILAGFVAGVAFLYLLGILMSRDQRKRISPTESGYILGPQEVGIETEGVRVKSEHHDALYRWALIGSPEITEQHAFIMVDRIAGIIVPRRSFASEAEWNGFIEAIQSRKLRSESYWMAAPARMRV